METAPPTIRKIAFLGDYLPRKCGIATFTSDLLTSVAAEHPQSQCFAVPVNDVEDGYEYPGVVRFEIEEQDLLVLPARGGLHQHQQRGHRLRSARVWDLRRARRPPCAGAGSRTENARRHHVPYPPARAQRHPAARDAGIDCALDPAGDHDRTRTPDVAGYLQGARPPRSTSFRMAFPTSRLWIPIITRTSLAWKEGRCCSPSGCFRPTRELSMS